MRNVFRVFCRDVKRIAKNPAAWLVAIVLITLPSLYTWFNVLGFWNPYDNTGNLRVCVVNEDQGVDDETFGELDLGDMVVEQLHSNTQLGWQFVDRDEAMREVESGEAYAAFIIPSDFSSDITTFVTDDIQQPQLEYYVNQKVGPVAPKITDTGASTLDTTINDSFIATVSSAVASAIDQALEQSDASMEQTQGSAVGKLTAAIDDIGAARTSVADLATSANDAIAKVDSAQESLVDAKAKIVLLAGGLGDVSALAGEVNTGIVKYSGSLGTVLDKGSSYISQTSSSVNNAMNSTSGAIDSAAAQVDVAIVRAEIIIEQNGQILAELRALEQGMADGDAGKEQLDAVIDTLERENIEAQKNLDGLRQLSSDTANLANAAAGVSNTVNTAVQDSLKNVDGYRATVSDTTVPALSDGLTKTVAATADLSAAVSNQTLTIDQTSSVLDQLKSTLSISTDALAQTDSVLASIQDDLDILRTDVAALGTSSALSDLFGDDGIDAQKVADFMMSPTQVETEELYPLNAYGSAMAPLFINLTLWIGVFMLMVIMRNEVDDEGIENLTIAQRYLGRWLLLAIMVALQAIVCVAGCLYIGVQTVNAPAFFLTAVICSIAYLCIQYTLSTTLQHVGKAICVILVFVQIPGATGLYPVEMTTPFFQAIYPMFPFTYGVNAMRETICGFYDGAWLHEMGFLLAFAVVFVAIGILARPYLTNLNRLFARQLEESDIVNCEEVQLPERRFRVHQLIRVLSGREEYRAALTTRAARFMRLYPKLKYGAAFVGVIVPIAVTAALTLTQAEKVVLITVWLIWLALVIAFLIVIEYMRDSLGRQVSLESMTDQEVLSLYLERNTVAHHDEASTAASASACPCKAPEASSYAEQESHDERGQR